MFRLARGHEFVAKPNDRYAAGRCWLTFCVRDATAGGIVWGSPTLEDVREFMTVMPLSDSPLATRRPRYLDVRRLDGIEQAAVALIASFLSSHATSLYELVSRAAIVSQSPLGRALVNGFPALTAFPYELKFFDEPAVALAWLGLSDVGARELEGELDALCAVASGLTEVVRQLRGYLADHLHDAELATAARALGMSARGLQRKLTSERTTFQRELDQVRFEAATARLARSELTVADVARSVGTSPRNLAAIFRRLSSTSPRQRRQRST